MKAPKSRIKKRIIITVGILLGIWALIMLFISPIAKYLIEKHSVKYTGRQIRMSWIYLNPFTGYAHINNLKIYEANSDSIFISANGFNIGINIPKLLRKEIEITSISLDKPRGIALQSSKNTFNFSDIIERFSSKPSDTVYKEKKTPTPFSILNIRVTDGTFYIRDTLIPINYYIKNFNFESSGKKWGIDSFPGKFSFAAGIGTGKINGRFNIRTDNADYKFIVAIQNLNLDIIQQYLQGIVNYGTFSAHLNANVITTGNFKDVERSDSKGRFSVNDFHFGKTRNEDYASFDTLIMAMNEVNPKAHIYHLDSVTIKHPYFKFELYDSLNNVENMFGKKGANVKAVNANKEQFNLIIALAHYMADLSRNFFKSAYKINNVAIDRADLKFNDYSASEKFSIEASPLSIAADSIDKNRKQVELFLKTGIKPYGSFSASANINPRDSADFDLTYHLANVPLPAFNPYLISYTSFPLDRGTIEATGAWKVRKGLIQAENHLLIVDPRITKRLKNNGIHWIPMWLVMAFARERSNVIDYQIPITGNLKNPTFHLNQVILSILTNIIVKPPTTPYRMEIKALENEIEKSLTLNWGMRQATMTSLQEKFTNAMADFLVKNPDASIAIYPQQYEAKEKEYILFFEAKKKYYLSLHPEKSKTFNKDDSNCVDRMSVKDPSFVHYLNRHLSQSLVFTIQEKCSNIVPPSLVNTRYEQLNKSRENIFLSFFRKKGVENRVRISPGKNCVPYNGFSFYKIGYSGEYPTYLLNAYQKMNELNNEMPREKYNKERASIKSI